MKYLEKLKELWNLISKSTTTSLLHSLLSIIYKQIVFIFNYWSNFIQGGRWSCIAGIIGFLLFFGIPLGFFTYLFISNLASVFRWIREQIILFFSFDNLLRYFLVIVLITGGFGFFKLNDYYNNVYKGSKQQWVFRPKKDTGITPPFICKPSTFYSFFSRYGFKEITINYGKYKLTVTTFRKKNFWVCFPEETTVQCICVPTTWNDLLISKGKLTIQAGKREGDRLY